MGYEHGAPRMSIRGPGNNPPPGTGRTDPLAQPHTSNTGIRTGRGQQGRRAPAGEQAAPEHLRRAASQLNRGTASQGPQLPPAPPRPKRGVKPGEFISVTGSVHTPQVVLKPADVVRQVKDGTMKLDVPMVGGADLGLVSVREDTHAVADVVISNGKIDRRRTQIRFETSDGKETDLDGPLWWNAEKIYIDSDGQIRADVPCFPDPNITSKVLGEGVDKVPEDPAQFLALLSRGANLEQPLLDPHSLTPPAAAAKTAATPGAPPPSTGGAATRPASGGGDSPNVGSVLNLGGLRAQFIGTMKSGPISFGDGTQLTVREDAPVQISGTLDDLRVSVDVDRVDMESKGTAFRGHNGRVDVSIRRPDSNADGAPDLEVEINALDLDRLDFETPGGAAKHQLTAHNVRAASRPGEPALMRVETRAGGDDTVSLHLAGLEMHDVSGALHATDTHGEPTTMLLGRRGARANRAPLDLVATLTYDSEAKRFTFDSQTENLSASVGNLGLVDVDNFDLDLTSAELTGSGRVTLTQTDDDVILNMVANEDSEWRLEARVHDAHIGEDDPSQLGLHADVAPETAGILRLRNLNLSNEGIPEFQGTADFQVTLDGLTIPLPEGNSFDLRPGTRGRLRIDSMSYKRGDRSAAVDAQLILDLGADVVVTPGEIPGLEGARVAVDVDTGKTQLIIDAKVHPDGRLEAACGIHLQEVGVRTLLAKDHEGPLPAVSIPNAPLPEHEPFTMAQVTPLPGVRPVAPPQSGGTEINPPALPQLRLRPGDIFRSIDRTTVNVNVPSDALDDVLIHSIDKTTIEDIISPDRIGPTVKFFASRAAKPIDIGLVIHDGKVVPGQSQLVLDPPLDVRTAVRQYGRFNIEIPITLHPTVKNIRIERDPETGMGYLMPDVEHGILDAAGVVGLEGDFERWLGEQISDAVFGTKQIPLESDLLMTMLEERFPALGNEIVIGPKGARVESPAERPAAPSPATPDSAPPPPAAPAAAPSAHPAEALIKALKFDEADIDVGDAIFRPVGDAGHINLGDGQEITFLPGTELKLTGTPNNFTLEGSAELANVVLGNTEVGGTFDHGQAHVRIHVERDADGKPTRVEVEVGDINGRGLNVFSRIGGALTTAEVDEIRGGKISVIFDGSETTFAVDLPEQTTARLVGAGSASREGYEGRAASLAGEVTGTLSLRNGRVTGDFTKVDIAASGVAFGSASETTEAGRVALRGPARLETDERGAVHLVSATPEQPLTIDTDLTLSSGAQVVIAGGHTTRVSFEPNFSGVTFSGIDARVRGKIPIGERTGDPETESILDIRKGRFQGALRIDRDGVTTVGEAAFSEFEGSVTNVDDIESGESHIDMKQIDLAGSGRLRLGRDDYSIASDRRVEVRRVEVTDGTVTERPDGTKYVFVGGRRRELQTVSEVTRGLSPGWYQRASDGALFVVEQRSTMTGRALARDFQFNTASPNFLFDMADGTQMRFDLDRLNLHNDGSVAMDVRHGEVSGILDTGTATVGSPGDVLEKIQITGSSEGPARVWAEVDHLSIGTGRYSGEGRDVGFELEGALRVEGRVEDEAARLPEPLQLPGSRIEIDKVEMGFNLRFMLGMSYDNGAFAASSHSLLDDDGTGAPAVRIDASGHVDGQAAYKRAMNYLTQPDDQVPPDEVPPRHEGEQRPEGEQ